MSSPTSNLAGWVMRALIFLDSTPVLFWFGISATLADEVRREIGFVALESRRVWFTPETPRPRDTTGGQ